MSYENEARLEDEYLMPTYGRKAVELVSGQGMRVNDSTGCSYLDFIAGVGADSLGHCHPAVVAALNAQAQRLIHVSNYYYIEGRGELAQTVSNLLNACVPLAQRSPWRSFFSNSGAESNECAIKLARLYSKRFSHGGLNIITLDHSFHGRTLATLAATAQPAKQESFKPLPQGFLHTPLNDSAALEALFAAHPQGICAIMLEVIQGESGVHPATAEFLQTASRLAHENGALLICDEVQTGIYRCGTYPFAFQHFSCTPDIVTIAKGIASGFPTGLCAARSEVAAAFAPGDHGSTFGGSPLAIAAARATLATIEEEGLPAQVSEVGAYFREQLATLEGVTQVRGRGLMCACDLAAGIDAFQVVARGLENGLLLNATGASTLRFLPPLVCTRSEIDELLAKLEHLF
ncbi:MAG: acetylornithine/succinylornithine family transaminase [Raoultibacter sp.]